VLELGAGCSGLASIALKKFCSIFEFEINMLVELTDGQLENIPYLE